MRGSEGVSVSTDKDASVSASGELSMTAGSWTLRRLAMPQ